MSVVSPLWKMLTSCVTSSAKIQSMKTAVPKNDKKRRKQMTEEINRLEADLSLKHKQELGQFKATAAPKVNNFTQPHL